MEASASTTTTVAGFNKSLDELLHFADSLKLREKELEQQHNLALEKQKGENDILLQIEKRRVEQLQEINRILTEQVERAAQKQIELEHKHTILVTKYNCSMEEYKQVKEQHQNKNLRIEELEKIARMLRNEKIKLDTEIKELKTDNETLQEQVMEKSIAPPPTTTASPPTQRVPDEFIKLVEKAVAENSELKNLLTERDNEIQLLNEQLNKVQSEDPQVVEQRLLQLASKLKSDFGKMYENQSSFFLQKIDLLKQEQRDNIASLYKH